VGFDFGDDPVGPLRPSRELVEKDRLTDPAKSAEDQPLPRPADSRAVQEDVDRVDLEIPADQRRWPATRSGAVRVVNCIHSLI
jgi:hypothetical protein